MDISLYYQERGDGLPMVLLHGNGEDGNYFKAQIDYFSNYYRVIAVDTRGHGASPRGRAPFTIRQFAEDLNYLLQKLNLSKIILLGFSDGANIAMEFAINYSDKLVALILDGGNLNREGMKKTFELPVEVFYKFTKIFSNKSENAKRKMELLNLMVNEPKIETYEIKKINVPTLVIAGTKDIVKISHTREIAQNIPNSTLQIIDGNHFIAREKGDVFNENVHKFLTKTLTK